MVWGVAVMERHSWTDAIGNPWTPSSGSDRCVRCGKTPDTHRPDCGTPLGTRLVRSGSGLRWTLHRCSKPAVESDKDGRLRCVQHARMSRGMPGKWVGPA